MLFTFISTEPSFRYYNQPLRPPTFSFRFNDILSRLLCARDSNELLYITRWSQDGDRFEDVLEAFLLESIKGRPESPAALNQLVNALIIALEGGDPAWILDADPDELLKQYQAENPIVFPRVSLFIR